ncbi:hypothetical protein EON73_00505 [bacterium]|nr:MAG: hypothetical protein EON73_00505 [bacterium]
MIIKINLNKNLPKTWSSLAQRYVNGGLPTGKHLLFSFLSSRTVGRTDPAVISTYKKGPKSGRRRHSYRTHTWVHQILNVASFPPVVREDLQSYTKKTEEKLLKYSRRHTQGQTLIKFIQWPNPLGYASNYQKWNKWIQKKKKKYLPIYSTREDEVAFKKVTLYLPYRVRSNNWSKKKISYSSTRTYRSRWEYSFRPTNNDNYLLEKYRWLEQDQSFFTCFRERLVRSDFNRTDQLKIQLKRLARKNRTNNLYKQLFKNYANYQKYLP